jgi:hypothetical protein
MERNQRLPDFGSLFLGTADQFNLTVQAFQELFGDGTGPDYRATPLDRCPGVRVVCAPCEFFVKPGSDLLSETVPPMLVVEILTDRDPHIVAAGFIEALKSEQGLNLSPDPDNKFLNQQQTTLIPCRALDSEILERLGG